MRTERLDVLRTEDDPGIEALLPYGDWEGFHRLADGSVGQAWWLGAVEAELLSDSARAELTTALDGILRRIPERAAFQVLLLRDREVAPPWPDPADPVLAEIRRSRAEAFRTFEIDHEGAAFAARRTRRILTLRLFPPHAPRTGWREILWSLTGRDALLDRWEKQRARLEAELSSAARAIETAAGQIGLGLKPISGDEFRALVHDLLNPGRPAGAGYGRSNVSFDFDSGVVRINGWAHRMVSVVGLPPSTCAGMLTLEHAFAGGRKALVDLLGDAWIAFNGEIPDPHAVHTELAIKKRLAFAQVASGEARADLAVMKGEIDRLQAEIFAGGARVASVRIHVVLRSRDAEHLDRCTQQVLAALGRAGFDAIVEDALTLSLLLQSLPLAYDPANDRRLKRGRKMVTENVAHLLPVWGAFAGTRTADVILLNRRGEPCAFSLFDSDSAPHGIICGVTGSGKSFFTNYLVSSVLMRGDRVFLLDRGGSYRRLCESLGGRYYAFDEDPPPRINPCAGARDDDANVFLSRFVAELIGQGQEAARLDDLNLISEAAREAVEEREEATLSDVQAVLLRIAERDPALRGLARRVAHRMKMFVRPGPYARFFDGAHEVRLDRPLVVFELGELALRPEIASPLVMAILKSVSDACRAERGRRKYLLVDEAWTLLRSENASRFIENAFRTFRKYGCAAVMITQQVGDFAGPTGAAIRANAPNRILLRQTPDTILAMRDLLDLSPEEKHALESLQTVKGAFSEALILAPETRGMVRLVPDPLSYWLFTTDAADARRFDEEVRACGSVLEAARRLGRSGR